MLKSMIFKNFINFKNRRKIEFSNEKPNIFIGGNSTGKSSVLELIKRCMSTVINATKSSSYNESQNAYVFCTFELKQKPDFYPSKIISICSGVIKTTKPPALIKVVWIDCDEEDKSKLMVLYMKDGEFWEIEKKKTFLSSTLVKNDKKVSSIMRIITEEITDDPNDNQKEKEIMQLLIEDVIGGKVPPSSDKDLKETGIHLIDEISVLKVLDDAFVGIFPYRSIGTCQWTWSKAITSHEENYRKANEKAEILNALAFDSDKVSVEEADKIFHYITSPAKFKFRKDNEEITVQDMNSDKVFKLLKTPEGVVAAREFSLLMALKNVKTMCFEEPDRGMHPEYIERMRDVLIQNSDRKCVILVTHSQYLINTRTAENTHVFFRLPKEEQKTPYGFKSISDLYRHMTDVDEMKKVAFASKVLFVEGKTDKIVMEGIFEYLNTEKGFDHHRQIVVQGSGTKPNDLQRFCNDINLDAVWLTDRDIYVKLDKDKNKITKIKLQNHGMDKGKTVEEFLQEGFESLRHELKREQEFIWKFGTIEDTIINDLTSSQVEEIFEIDPKQPKELKSIIKEKMKHIKRPSLQKLSKYLMVSKNEMWCFVEFLKNIID